jgi:hypothetical protein
LGIFGLKQNFIFEKKIKKFNHHLKHVTPCIVTKKLKSKMSNSTKRIFFNVFLATLLAFGSITKAIELNSLGKVTYFICSEYISFISVNFGVLTKNILIYTVDLSFVVTIVSGHLTILEYFWNKKHSRPRKRKYNKTIYCKMVFLERRDP